MPLTDLEIKGLKPKTKPYKKAHEKGLYLLVNTNGRKHWKLKYRFAGKEKKLSLGEYPELSLKMATQAMNEARKKLQEGLDPCSVKQEAKAKQILNVENSFKAIAKEWLDKQHLAENTLKKKIYLIKKLGDALGRKPINDITPVQLLAVIRPVEKQGKHETAKRMKGLASQVFCYGVSIGCCERDITQDLRGALTPPQVKHRAAITDIKEIPRLLHAIETFNGTEVVRAALQLAPLVFVRPLELRTAQWCDIDLEAAEWRYQVSKTNTDHIVPLSKQALKILKDIQPLTGRGRYVFPSARSNYSLATNQRPMSENAITAALRTLGFSGEVMTGHGFRAMARTVLDEY